MKALILAAGLGTRLRPITNTTPKVLVEIGGQPLLTYHLLALQKAGVSEVLINTHYLSEKVDDYLSNNDFGLQVSTVYEPELLGSAGTLLANKDFFAKEKDFLIIYGDNLTNIKYRQLFSEHQNKAGLITMACYFEHNPAQKGVVEIDQSCRIKGIKEKPGRGWPASYANGGVYIFNARALNYLCSSQPAPYDLAKAFFTSELFSQEKIYAYLMKEYLLDIGTLESLAQAQLDIQKLNF